MPEIIIERISEVNVHPKTNDLELVCYPYSKYGEYVLSVKLTNGMNFQIADLMKYYKQNNSMVEYERLEPGIEELAKRICLCVNFFTGKSEEEITNLKKQLEGK